MEFFINQKCEHHKNKYECPDCIMVYEDMFDEYGIIIHDGGCSSIKIKYCPWCGKKLPLSKRDLWFEELSKRGFDNPFEEEIPEEYNSDEWWINKGS